MSRTVYVEFSDEAIREHAADAQVSTLRDHRYPRLSFRYLSDRTKGTWSTYVDGKWSRRLGFPIETSAMVLERANDRTGFECDRQIERVWDLLTWYLDHQACLKKLSADRKSGLKSMINRHLLPMLGQLRVEDLSRKELSRRLIGPMMRDHSPSYSRALFATLKAAIRRARSAQLMARDPLAGVGFKDFEAGKIVPKPAALAPFELPVLVPMLLAAFDESPRPAMLALMMLLYGTRVGETRKAKWCDIRRDVGVWVIPAADTKTRTRHNLPLTPMFLALLDRYKKATKGRADSVYLFPAAAGCPVSRGRATDWIAGLGGGGWTSHDLRKLASSAWASLGYDPVAGELLLNHKLPLIFRTYAQGDMSAQMRALAMDWHGHLGLFGIFDG